MSKSEYKRLHVLERDRKLLKLKELVNKQIDDESLWHWPKSDLEKALREALLEVHGVVESED